MDLFIAAVVGAIVLRIVLDLTTLARSSPLFHGLYAVLFVSVGAVILVRDRTDFSGYASILVGIGWAVYATLSKRRSASAKRNE